MQARWTLIDNSNDKFRLHCDVGDCPLSVANLLQGKLHISTVHSNHRHSVLLSDESMIFIVTQFLTHLSNSDKQRFLDYFAKILSP